MMQQISPPLIHEDLGTGACWWSDATMRLRREMIQYLAQAIARDLSATGCIQLLGGREKVRNWSAKSSQQLMHPVALKSRAIA